MLTKCVKRSVLRRFLKAQQVWDFGGMTLESWALFTKVSEEVIIQLLPQIQWGQAGSALIQMSVDDIWGILVEVVNVSAKQTIPQRRQGGEPCPPKEEVPLN
jgi:hypothetical protein